MVRVVDGIHVAGMDAVTPSGDDLPDAGTHRAEMHRDVGRVGDQLPLGVEQGAGEVEPLLDVDRLRGLLQGDAHLFGDRHEQVVEDLEQDGVGHRDGVDADR